MTDTLKLPRQARELPDAERIAIEEGVSDRERQLADLEKQFRLLKQAEQLRDMADDMGRSFGDALGDIALPRRAGRRRQCARGCYS